MGKFTASERRFGCTDIHPYLAIIEAKRASQKFFIHESANHVLLVVSKEIPAPYLGEAIITWKANRTLLGTGVSLLRPSGRCHVSCLCS